MQYFCVVVLAKIIFGIGVIQKPCGHGRWERALEGGLAKCPFNYISLI